MAKAKAAPIRDGKQLLYSMRRARHLEKKNPNVPVGELRHSEETAVADIHDAWETFVDIREYQNKSKAGKYSAEIRKAIAQQLHEQVVEYAKRLLASGKEKRDLVSMISGKEFTDIFDKRRTYGRTQIRKILNDAELL